MSISPPQAHDRSQSDGTTADDGSSDVSSVKSASSPPADDKNCKIVCISDTHGQTPDVPDGDILIHAGDLSNRGTFVEIQKQLTWLQSLPHPHKIVIAGNHDDLLAADMTCSRRIETKDDLDWGNLIYLEDNSCTIDLASGRQLKIYGSPWTPLYPIGATAFQYTSDIDPWTDKIPFDTDIVISHGPPRGIVDNTFGDDALLKELARVKPRLVVCGHIHEARGIESVVLGHPPKKGKRVQKQPSITSMCNMLADLSFDTVNYRKVTTVINAAHRGANRRSDGKDGAIIYDM